MGIHRSTIALGAGLDVYKHVFGSSFNRVGGVIVNWYARTAKNKRAPTWVRGTGRDTEWIAASF
jgi:hypothetical protein